MQQKEELLEQLGETYGYVSRMVEQKLDYFKLDVAEKSAKTISGIITAAVLAVFGLLAFTFALITLGYFLSEVFESFVYGFGAVALMLLLIFLLILIFKRPLITDPTVSKVITSFFKHDGKNV